MDNAGYTIRTVSTQRLNLPRSGSQVEQGNDLAPVPSFALYGEATIIMTRLRRLPEAVCESRELLFFGDFVAANDRCPHFVFLLQACRKRIGRVEHRDHSLCLE